MKTLDEIINRNDYARVNNALLKRAPEIARIIRDKMEYLELDRIPGYHLALRKVNFNEKRALCIVDDVTSYTELFYYDLCQEAEHFNVGHTDDARSCDCLYFLNHAREVLNYLDNYESTYVAEAEKVLADTANI